MIGKKKNNSEEVKTSGMAQFKRKSKGKKKIKWIILGIALVLLILGFRACQKATQNALEAIQNMVSTDTVQKRRLIKSVGATGKIVSVSKKDVTTRFATSLDVTDVFVEVGDNVKEGDRLVAFDTSDIEEDLEDAEAALKRAQSSNGLSVSESRRNVADTERAKDYNIANAADALSDAKKAYQDAVDEYDDLEEDTDDAKDAMKKAKKKYEALQAQLDAASSDAEGYAELETQTAEAKEAYEKKNTDYQNIKKSFQNYKDNDVVQKAKDAMEQAQRDYDNIVANQDSSVASAKSSYSQAQLNSDTTAQERTVEEYKKQLEDGVLTAPVTGMVTHINVEKGESYSPSMGAVVTIQDVSAFEIEAEIGEYDISDIAVGQQVLIKTDATGDEELSGTVIKVSPVATSTAANTDVTYTVRISIDTPSDRLRLDMTASLSIIVTEHENALTVPYNAIQTDEDGKTFVELPGQDGINNEKKYVTVVMESNYYTEIAEGDLEEGTEIVVIDSTNDYLQYFEEGGF